MKTTKKDFELFKKECQRWIDKLELNNWTVNYQWRDLDKDNLDVAANSGVSTYAAYLELDTEFDDENTSGKPMKILIKEAAKHEVIHVLVKRLKILAISRYIREGELVEAEEELVRKLEKLLN